MRWLLSGVLAVTAAGAAFGQQPAGQQQLEVTLHEAIRRALDAQPAMVQARGDQRNAGATKRSAFGSYIPSLSVSASYDHRNTPGVSGSTGRAVPAQSYTGTVSTSLELFDGFRRFANLKSASASLDAADAGVVNQRFQTTLDTKQFFYTAIANEALVRVADAQVKRAQQQLQISVQKLRAGSATRSDSLRSTVEYGNARIALLQARAALATAQANLGRQIGVDGQVRAVFDSTLPALPDTVELRAALSTAPAVEQAEAEARSARAQVWSARSQYWPSVTLSYSNSHQGSKDPVPPIFSPYPETSQWRVGLSWALFNGFTREVNNTNASAARDLAEARAADARREVAAQLTQQLATLSTAFEQITIARENMAAATEDLRVQNERYRVGAATILDLLTSQAALTQAEVNVVQTQFNYLIARSQLEATVGRTL
ncbi:MAG TPA: TolC family protein [Gemmatimonadales bacterium]|nr:TolC family protein [Gemmatimonadales bacterium]